MQPGAGVTCTTAEQGIGQLSAIVSMELNCSRLAAAVRNVAHKSPSIPAMRRIPDECFLWGCEVSLEPPVQLGSARSREVVCAMQH